MAEPTHGVLTLNDDGSFFYTRDAQLDPTTDSFTYTVSDGKGGTSAPATVILDHGDDSYTTNQNTPLRVNAPGVLANDNFPPGGVIYEAALHSSHGQFLLYNDGSFLYTPDPGFTGTDSFSYSIYDGNAVSDPIQVTITVTPPPMNS